MSNFYKLTIKKIVKETKDAVSILFDMPEKLKEHFTFIAGQYVTLKATINNEEIRRAYSICASPNNNELKVAVKAVENGKFSSYAVSQLKEREVLEVSTPEGKFTLQPENNKNYLGIAAGSGITPVLSMVKSTLENSTSTFTLLYGNKSANDTIFYEELNSLKEKYTNRFNLQYVFSRAVSGNALSGRIDTVHVNNLVKENTFDASFLCGPEAMIQTVSKALEENNISKENIYFELFTTATTSEENTLEVSNGETQVKILLDDEEERFTMKQTDTILAASLRNNVDAPYSCQGGVCSSCIAKVTQGKAVMSKNSILSEEELEDGLILTCVAHPTTATLVVDFDEV